MQKLSKIYTPSKATSTSFTNKYFHFEGKIDKENYLNF